ncbi:hypothetical protein ACFL2K_02125 [Candidatus Margulisiibacteriota bacterium]
MFSDPKSAPRKIARRFFNYVKKGFKKLSLFQLSLCCVQCKDMAKIKRLSKEIECDKKEMVKSDKDKKALERYFEKNKLIRL